MIAETSNRTVTRIESSLWVERSSFYLRRNNLRLKQLACWPPLYSDAFENIDEPRTPYSVMIAETISSACFVLLVVVFCCMIKIYTMVKNIRPSRNERVRVVCARDNERAFPVEREPNPKQHTADHKRDGDNRKQKMSGGFSTTRNFFLSLQPVTIQAVYYHLLSFLTWCDIVFTIFTEVSVSNSSQATEEYWTRNEFPSQAPKWRWQVVNIYRAVKQRGKEMILTHYSYNDYTIFSGANRAWNAREWTAKVFEVWGVNQSVPPTLFTANWTFISF